MPECGQELKACKFCGKAKPLTEFYKAKLIPRSHCKPCRRAYARENKRTVGGQYASAKNVANQRGMIFNIPLGVFAAMRSQSCHYCGGLLNETSTGLDRVDSLLGYVVGNVVPCCDPCNHIKADVFTFAEMLVIGRAVAQVWATRGPAARPPCIRGGRKRMPD